jgi:NitT/TauT family transport system ATP-binding protein
MTLYSSSGADMPLFMATRVEKSFQSDGTDVKVFEEVTISADRGEVLVLRGSNGCGKTTLLNVIAGLESPTSGHIEWASPFRGKPIAYVFQNYNSALLPWLTIGENILLPLRLARYSRREQLSRWSALAESYDISAVPTERFPAEASGGQKQRAAIARALLCSSPVVLLDEPFSALDTRGHRDLVAAVERLRNDEQRLIVMVLHDLDDAILLADRLLVLAGSPASVVCDFRVNLARPRSYEQKTTPEFIRLRNLVLEQSA